MGRTLGILLAALAAACSGPNITPLARAARSGDAAAIAALAAAGHDVNRRDPGGNHWTPLLHAIHNGQRASVEALLAAGADVHVGSSRPPPGARAAAGVTPLMMAVSSPQADVVRRLLAAGADPRGDGARIFVVAVSGGALTDIDQPLLGRCNADIVRALLERDPTLRLPPNGRGHLALWLARWNNCQEVARMVGFG